MCRYNVTCFYIHLQYVLQRKAGDRYPNVMQSFYFLCSFEVDWWWLTLRAETSYQSTFTSCWLCV